MGRLIFVAIALALVTNLDQAEARWKVYDRVDEFTGERKIWLEEFPELLIIECDGTIAFDSSWAFGGTKSRVKVQTLIDGVRGEGMWNNGLRGKHKGSAVSRSDSAYTRNLIKQLRSAKRFKTRVHGINSPLTDWRLSGGERAFKEFEALGCLKGSR